MECKIGKYQMMTKKPYKKAKYLVSICLCGGDEDAKAAKKTIEGAKKCSLEGTSYRIYVKKKSADTAADGHGWVAELEKQEDTNIVYYWESGEEKSRDFDFLFPLFPASSSPGIPSWAGGIPPGTPVIPLSSGCNVEDNKILRWILRKLDKFDSFAAWGAGTGASSGGGMVYNSSIPTLRMSEMVYKNFRFPLRTIVSLAGNPTFVIKGVEEYNKIFAKKDKKPEEAVLDVIVNWVFYTTMMTDDTTNDVFIAKYQQGKDEIYEEIASCLEKSMGGGAEATKDERLRDLAALVKKSAPSREVYGKTIDLYSEFLIKMSPEVYFAIANEYLTMPEGGKMTYHVGIKIGRSRISLHHNDKFPTP